MSDNKARAGTSANSEIMIDWYSVVTDVAQEWFSIFMLTISAGILAYTILTNFRHLDYATSATMVVTNINEDINADVSSGTDVYENLNYGADSASRLKNILQSKEMKDTVAKELGLESFRGTTSAQTLGESNLLEITVRSDSPYISYKEAESILRNYIRFSGDLVGGTELTVLEWPKVQESPEHPLENIKYAILFTGAVFVAVCAVLAMLSLMRDTVHNSEEAESKVDAKLLATIMHENKYRKGRKRIAGEKTSILITNPVTSFRYAEDMRKLAARVINEMTEAGQKTLLVGSTMENEGKSTIAVNIALAMAQIKERVVLVDMDFRKPSVYKILNMQDLEFKSLSDTMKENGNESQSDMSEVVRPLINNVSGTDLKVILNRNAVPQAVERYPEIIRALLEELKKEADFIIIDTAPIGLISDAEELATMADTSIIVVRQHWVEAKDINDTIDALGGRDRILGCVFNNASKNSMGGAFAGYGYGYGYGGQYAK